MRTKLVLMLVAPALLLAGCAKAKDDTGEEVTDEAKVASLKQSISDQTKEIKDIQFHFKAESEHFDEDLKQSVKTTTEYVYNKNEAGEIYLTASAKGEDGATTKTDFYLVKNETYELVAYIDTVSEDEHNISAMGYKGNEDNFVNSVMIFYSFPESYYQMFVDPNKTEEFLPIKEENGYKISEKYYSSGEGNLTVKINYEWIGESSSSAEEKAVRGEYLIQYDGGFFQSAEVNMFSDKGSHSTNELSLTLMENLTFTLPDGWESFIQ